jgi:hypothetical protein
MPVARRSRRPYPSSRRSSRPDPTSGPDMELMEFQIKFLQEQLDSEKQRKQSLEQRGITVITSAGAIATLIFAVSAFVSKSISTASFVRAEALPIKLSIVAFLVAALFGLATNLPFRYGAIVAKSLNEGFSKALVKEGGSIGYRLSIIRADSEILRRNQRLNFFKSEILLGGFVFEIIGIGLLVWAVFEITSHAL